MSLRVYNTLTNEKEQFEPVMPGKIGIYLCGPTVYKSPHIGHMVGPVIFDAIKRYLVYKGYSVTWVVNITDVEDKLIEAAATMNRPVNEVAAKYTQEYMSVLAAMGIDTIDRFPKASEHMNEIIEITQKLVDNGHAYAVDGNVYFDVAKDADYGKLSNRKVEEQESGNRAIEAAGKKNPADFALWKSAKPGEPTWDSPWGKGRPGWHIECSAMSMKYLGQTFDIHGGGMDLMFPHHENELAQSECATGKTFAKYWLHNGLTRLNTKKMSGSIGNVVSAQKLIDDHGPQLLRYMLLSTQYRRPIEFNDEVLTAAKKGLSVFTRLLERIARLGATLEEKSPDLESISAEAIAGPDSQFVRDLLGLKMKFLEMMDDDFNTAGAIGVLHETAGAINAFIESNRIESDRSADRIRTAAAGAQTFRKLGMLLGLFRIATTATPAADKGLANDLMELILQLRATARTKKDFATADAIREGLTKIGITVEDRSSGTEWKKN